MEKPKAFENYPLSTVLITNVISLLNYFIGFYLLYLVNPLFSGLWIIYVIYLEVSLYKGGCRHCYYYGKVCFCGRGKIVPFLFKKGNPKVFCQKRITWKNLLPTVLVSIIPVVVGIYLLIQIFDWFILTLTIYPLLNWFILNPFMYGKLVCLHCKQGRICCPANEFFGKKAKK